MEAGTTYLLNILDTATNLIVDVEIPADLSEDLPLSAVMHEIIGPNVYPGYRYFSIIHSPFTPWREVEEWISRHNNEPVPLFHAAFETVGISCSIFVDAESRILHKALWLLKETMESYKSYGLIQIKINSMAKALKSQDETKRPGLIVVVKNGSLLADHVHDAKMESTIHIEKVASIPVIYEIVSHE